MTSMPLTLRTIFRGSIFCLYQSKGSGLSIGGSFWSRCPSRLAGGVGEGAVNIWQGQSDRRRRSRLAISRCAPRELLVDRVFVRRGLDHRLEDLLVGLVPIRREVPFRAVPGMD